ncbi:GNAT family N-acetyltransferase [Jannaschia rubra]|uniref:GNAT family N-acetyltransferase n=1 Tax=Jannaschia rubra TaxID=282197 RepID=UPI002491A225|nr:GNAT family protein [Jannaschia rubra]
MTEAATWRPLSWTPPEALEGRWARLERLSPRRAAALHAANPTVADHWRYLAYGPFPTAEAYGGWVAGAVALEDPAFYAVRSVAGWTGVLALMRVDRANGVIEIGHIAFSPGLQRTPASTEAIHLLLDHAFASGFRRVEWKCNVENAPSRRAASRLGFTAEGVFRQHMMVGAATGTPRGSPSSIRKGRI